MINSKRYKIFSLIIILYAFKLVFVSIDNYVKVKIGYFCNLYYLEKIIGSITLNHIFLIFFPLFLIIRFKIDFRRIAGKKLKIFLLSLFSIGILFLTPNQSIGVKIDALAPFIWFLIILAIYLSLNEEIYFLYVRKLFYYMLIFIFVISLYSLVLFITGNGSSFFYGINATIQEGDTLDIIAFFQTVLFAFR